MGKRLVLVVGASLLVACSGGSGAGANGPCGPCQASSGAAGRPAPPRSAKLEQLALQRVELAQKRLVLMREGFTRGTVGLDALFAACRDVAFAARDSGLHGEPLKRILTEYRDAVVAMKELTRDRLAKGAVGEEAMKRVEALVAEAEFWLAQAVEGT